MGILQAEAGFFPNFCFFLQKKRVFRLDGEYCVYRDIQLVRRIACERNIQLI